MSDTSAREAAERLRKHESLAGPVTLQIIEFLSGDHQQSLVTLSHAYLSEHPADEDEPINIKWAEATFKESTRSLRYQRLRYQRLFAIDIRWLYLQADACEGPQCWRWSVVACERIIILENPTRGQLRRLIAALGIELKAEEQP